ncbi:MAG TPA: CusA/CzcA family heavy metal efflux RND transporter [Cytophagaceae bacterium]|jgi:cobalt-zinc-cadmium resistance protein CzcA|nr:CusA/CzcA family heavy metal efflux RND transporter [Cytophagaceae bacterium]
MRIITLIIGFSLKNRLFIFILTAVLIAAGTLSYINTPIEAFPDVTNTQIKIITQWPGRSAEEIEKFVTIPIEIGMNPVQKKTSVRSTSLFGLSAITIIFDDEVEDFYARQQVMNLLKGVSLPDGVDAEVQPPYGPTGEIFRYTLSSQRRSIKDIKTIQDWTIDRHLRSVPGVADIVSFGGEVKTYEISIDPHLLSKYDISSLDVFQAVGESNINVGGDIIEKNNQAFVVRGLGLLSTIPDIENIIITNIEGTPILVKNVADVVESSLPRLGQVGRDNREDVVEGIVVMRKGENPHEVLTNLKAKIEYLNNNILPADVQINTFYDRDNLINFTTHTVIHNLIEGIILVTIVVFLFMADWRTTLIVSIIIPLALLFAFICMRIKGMSANLLSMGAIDFGIIIDGAVVMVEGLFVTLDHRAHKVGMPAYNKLLKYGMIRKTGSSLGKAIFFSKLIIITALLPIFAFQKVEGKMFSPLAYTLGFALIGAMLCTLTLVPVLASILLDKNVREKNNPFVNFITSNYLKIFNKTYHRKKLSLLLAVGVLATSLFTFNLLGTEFLPHLNEGAVYVRASLPLSTSLKEAERLTIDMKNIFQTFPEVKQVLSQTGRPNDGTDPTGFFNVEFHVDIFPQEQWKKKISVEELIEQFKEKLSIYPGVNFNFSQPIMDNVEEAVAGVKGSIAVKIYGDNLDELNTMANSVYGVLDHVEGIEDLGILRNLGQPELKIELSEEKMGIYGVTTADCQSVIEMAVGGKTVSQLYEGNKKFDIRLRYLPQFRKTEKEIGNLMVPSINNTKIPLKELAKISFNTGPAFIYRENNDRFIAIKFSVRGRDMGSTIAEAQEKVGKALTLSKHYRMEWKGDFENQERATKRLKQIVPITLVLIFLILFMTFGNISDAFLVLINVPFALIGGIFALFISNTIFSISAGIGFIALFGICVQDGVILLSIFKENLKENMSLEEAIRSGLKLRVRPVIMTAMMATLGLLPAALSHGIGSETQKPLAIVVIGGLVSATLLTLLIFPLIFQIAYSHKGYSNLR